MTMSKIKLMCALSVLTVAGVVGQLSCVQLNATDLAVCACEDASLTFTIEGETTVAANTVNLALVLDGSGSIDDQEFMDEQAFAEDTVAAFSGRNLFDNGGMASYVQYSSGLVSSGMFDSFKKFHDFASADAQSGKGTLTPIGINEGTRLLGVNPASASFMIVITDGRSNSVTATRDAADKARAAGITVFAVGVGAATGNTELEAIGGGAANVFTVAQFDLLDAALVSILSSSGGAAVACPSTGANVTIEFSVPVACSASGAVSGTTVTFAATDLESTPTEFDVLLDLCSEVPGGSVVVAANYTDDQGNMPDLSSLTGLVVGNTSCAVPPPKLCKPEPVPVCDTNSTRPTPMRGDFFKAGSATNATYHGCFIDEPQNRTLHGPVSVADNMTIEMCADNCRSKGYEYFGTAYGSDCHCGCAEPTSKRGWCDYECAGDNTMACGGSAAMSVYMFDKDGKN